MMKPIIIPILCFVGPLTLPGAEEPFIPVALNAVLPKIHARMTLGEVKAVLAPAYPKLEVRMGPWSGGVGEIAYKLTERYTVSISAITREGKDVVNDEFDISLQDCKHPSVRRLKSLGRCDLLTRIAACHADTTPTKRRLVSSENFTITTAAPPTSAASTRSHPKLLPTGDAELRSPPPASRLPPSSSNSKSEPPLSGVPHPVHSSS